ncbi:MAG TPA: SDR family oxidoreductase [Acidimicrobiia bacterium]|nr:SDR family oxidoreductase [Acidimicrobiia bacterium]
MDLGISGKTAAVAAASEGLGLGCARALAAEGVRVAICGRRRDAIEAAAASIGDGCVPLVADLGHPDGAGAFVDAAIDALGTVDILVANAGGPPAGTFASTSLDAYAEAFDLNCRSIIAMCQRAIPPMRERRWGRVVAITSIGARAPIGNLVASSTARAAVTAFLKVTAREVAADGVTVNSLQPGFHTTARLTSLHDDEGLDALAATVPTKTLGDADDFGAAAAFLCSQQARFVTGVGLLVDGGAYPGLM